ncbi:MAG: D-ribose pyranase [Candidatus Izemoplasmatales bacterium]
MKKNGILNSEIAKVLADLGHTDMIAVADCGLPIPSHIKKIDLSIDYGIPSFQEISNLLNQEIEVEAITIAKEMIDANEENHNFVVRNFNGKTMSYVSHEDLKKLISSCKAVIRTGENTPYSNIILHAGVVFERSQAYEGNFK